MVVCGTVLRCCTKLYVWVIDILSCTGIMYNLRQTIPAWLIALTVGVPLNKITQCNNSHLEIPVFPLRGTGLGILQCCVTFLFSLYVLPDRRLTSYFQSHYSAVTPEQGEKSITVKAYCVCQNPRLVIYILCQIIFSAKCECLITSNTLQGLIRYHSKSHCNFICTNTKGISPQWQFLNNITVFCTVTFK